MKEEKLYENHRVNLNLSVDTIKKVKDYAKEIGISATSAYSVLINRGLNVESFMKNNSLPLDSLKQDIKYIVLQEPIEYDNLNVLPKSNSINNSQDK